MFEHVEPFGGDPILSLNEDFQKDPRAGKINLSIGIYFDDAGHIPVLDVGAACRGGRWSRSRWAETLSADRRGGELSRVRVQRLLCSVPTTRR